MKVNDQQVTFNVLEAMRNPDEIEDCNFLSVVDLIVADSWIDAAVMYLTKSPPLRRLKRKMLQQSNRLDGQTTI